MRVLWHTLRQNLEIRQQTRLGKACVSGGPRALDGSTMSFFLRRTPAAEYCPWFYPVGRRRLVSSPPTSAASCTKRYTRFRSNESVRANLEEPDHRDSRGLSSEPRSRTCHSRDAYQCLVSADQCLVSGNAAATQNANFRTWFVCVPQANTGEVDQCLFRNNSAGQSGGALASLGCESFLQGIPK